MLKYPLMRNNFSRSDLDAVITHLQKNDPILTNGPNCKDFEKEWSDWLGTKESVFVNSGSSANLLSMTVLKIKYPQGGEVIVPPLTWISDIASVLQTGFKPVFADISPYTLSMDTDRIIEKVTPDTRAVFLSHIQGFNGLTDRLLDFLNERKIPLIEDVCESHGATHNGQRVGGFGMMSNFSFYYAHHMSTVEGGMVSTNDDEVYELLRMLRSHGMVREASKQATVERLDENNLIRGRNQNRFLANINSDVYQTEFLVEGSSNYAFNLILNKKDDALMDRLMGILDENGVEFRRGSAGGGNQLRQPYLREVIGPREWVRYPITEHVHFYGMYIGNFPDLSIEEVDEIVEIVNSAVKN